MPKHVVGSNLVLFVPDATPFHFGVLSSVMHMAWMRQIGGRLESRYRYSGSMVYNNYPWPESATAKQRALVEEKAQAVLAARAVYLDVGDDVRSLKLKPETKKDSDSQRLVTSSPTKKPSTLAALYDPLTMKAELVKAHTELDRAVEKCYRPEPFHSDRERVEYLFGLYEKLTAPLLPATPKTKGRRSPAATAAKSGKTKTPGLYAQKIPPGKETTESAAAAAHFYGKEEGPPYRTA